MKDLESKIEQYISDNPIEIYVDRDDILSPDTLIEIWGDPANALAMIDDMYSAWDFPYNAEFIEEMRKALGLDDDVDLTDFYPTYYLDTDRVLNMQPDVILYFVLYSNYDCTNSFDTLDTSEYLQQVLTRVQPAVDVNDFMWEHSNGAYGGSVFIFPFASSFKDALAIKEKFKTASQILIPKGTQFGFYSDWQGAASVFDKVTTEDFWLSKQETGKGYYPEYDKVCLQLDLQSTYPLQDVLGCYTSYFNEIELDFK